MVNTQLTSSRRRALLLDVGIAAPVGRVVGGAVGPPIRRCGGRGPWWRTSAVAVVDWMRLPVWQCFSTEKHCHSVRQRQFAVALLVHKICGVGRLNFTLDGVATHYVKYQNS